MVLALPLALALAALAAAIEVIITIAIVVLCAFLVYAVVKYIIESITTLAPPGTDTFDRTWERATSDAPTVHPPIAIPLPGNSLEKVRPEVLEQVKELVEEIAKTEALKRGPWNVYDLHVNKAGRYNDYSRGNGYNQVRLLIGEIYKYGTTQKNSVYQRYEVAEKFQKAIKDQYIFDLLKENKLGALEWYLYRYNQAIARALENALIHQYRLIHNKFPPGNTGYY